MVIFKTSLFRLCYPLLDLWVLDAKQNHYSDVLPWFAITCFRSSALSLISPCALISFGQSFGAMHPGYNEKIAHEMRLLLDTLNHCLCCCLHFMHVHLCLCVSGVYKTLLYSACDVLMTCLCLLGLLFAF